MKPITVYLQSRRKDFSILSFVDTELILLASVHSHKPRTSSFLCYRVLVYVVPPPHHYYEKGFFGCNTWGNTLLIRGSDQKDEKRREKYTEMSNKANLCGEQDIYSKFYNQRHFRKHCSTQDAGLWVTETRKEQAAEADLRWKMNLVLTFGELHLPSSVNITYLNKL